jgi:hypothetical protein
MSIILNEELNRMKSLLNYQKGKVISEQESLPGYHKSGPQNIENIKDPFDQQTGTEGVDIKWCLKYNKNILDIPTNRAMVNFQIKTQLSLEENRKIYCSIMLMREKFAEFAPIRQKYINEKFCKVKNGLIVYPGNVWNGISWEDYVIRYRVEPAELEIAKKSCSKSNSNAAPKVTFTPNDKLPLKFKQKGENIKVLQMKLNMPKNLQTGNFYTKTEEYIKKIVPEYNRTTGVTQEVWDKIFNPKTKPTTPEQTIAPEKNIPTTNAPTNLNAQPANLTPNPALQQKK